MEKVLERGSQGLILDNTPRFSSRDWRISRNPLLLVGVPVENLNGRFQNTSESSNRLSLLLGSLDCIFIDILITKYLDSQL
jgi:hypothetical protein